MTVVKRAFLVAVRMAVVTLVLTGVVYPLVVTGLAALFFPDATAGSLVESGGRVVGSALIGQWFVSERYFHPRPSAGGYDATASGASNLAPTSARLSADVAARVAAVVAENPGIRSGAVPVDLVTASASGLDPHISPDSAYLQVVRVARARRVSEDRVRGVVAEHVAGRQLGFLGEPRVNVLELNLALDELFGR